MHGFSLTVHGLEFPLGRGASLPNAIRVFFRGGGYTHSPLPLFLRLARPDLILIMKPPKSVDKTCHWH